jgi:ribosomal protein S18 acetylase RimI-like enzyme
MTGHDVTMVLDDLGKFHPHPCPPGFRIRPYGIDDEAAWTTIETEAGEVESRAMAMERFDEWFGWFLDELPDRAFMLETDDGRAVGTAIAWHGEHRGETRGRVAWLAIVPEFQGRGLGKPLLTAVMQRLAREYSSAYVTVQVDSCKAVGLYLAFGFRPVVESDADAVSWHQIETTLGRRILESPAG